MTATADELLDRALCPVEGGGVERARDVLARGEVERVIAACATVAAVDVIRSLGFIGNAHYCADCMNHFHDDLGQHEPGCSVLASLLDEAREEAATSTT